MSEAVLSQVCTGNQHEVFRSFFDCSGTCIAKLDSAVRLIEANADFSRQFGRLLADMYNVEVSVSASRQVPPAADPSAWHRPQVPRWQVSASGTCSVSSTGRQQWTQS
jgi:hypothetical protein